MTVVLLGDSITANNNSAGTGGTQTSATGYFTWANMLMGSPLKVLSNAGVAGNTTAQMLARIGSDVLSYAPGYCVVHMATNDIEQGLDIDAVTIPNMLSICAQLKAAGIVTILLTTIPNDGSANTNVKKAATAKVLNWQRTLAARLPGVIVVDTARALTDPATGFALSGYLADSLHPNARGARIMGKAISAALSTQFVAPEVWTGMLDPRSYGANPGMNGSSADGSNGVKIFTPGTGVASYGHAIVPSGTPTTLTGSKLTNAAGEWRPESPLRVAVTPAADNTGASVQFACQTAATSQYDVNWAASTAYTYADRARPTTGNGFTYKLVAPGTSGSTEPAWPTIEGYTITDGTAVWLCQKMPGVGDQFVLRSEFSISGLGAADFANVNLRLLVVDTTNANVVDVYGNLLGSGNYAYAINDSYVLETPVVTLPNNTVRRIYPNITLLAKSGATVNLDIRRGDLVRVN